MSASSALVSATAPKPTTEILVHSGRELSAQLPRLTEYVGAAPNINLSRHPNWLTILAEGFGHVPYALEARRGEQTVGYLGLVFVKSLLFGRYLVSLPYLNYGGVLADDPAAEALLIDRAVSLASELRVRYLELRHEWAMEHPALGHRRTDKIHMRLDLPSTASTLWEQLSGKVRNQIRKAQKGNFTWQFGGADRIDEFYDVFSQNMRDLGTPVFGRGLFASIVRHFPDQAEFCIVRDGVRPIAAALLLHGWGVTEVPSASSLRSYNPSCVNMLMYWQLMERAIERGQDVFDFGRSSMDSPTHRFKKQWGAAPSPTEWQYHVIRGDVGELKPSNPKYQRMIGIWRRLPLWVTRTAGPPIARGIP
jgi:serine/alanine adding enzyme